MNSLTDRETQILRLVAEGSTDIEIADTFGLSAQTIKNYKQSIREKTGACGNVEFTHYALAHGVVKNLFCDESARSSAA